MDCVAPRVILSLADADAFSPWARRGLARLGYPVVSFEA